MVDKLKDTAPTPTTDETPGGANSVGNSHPEPTEEQSSFAQGPKLQTERRKESRKEKQR